MKSVGVADAKNNLSRYLDRVKRGERVRIFDRNIPVADLVPVQMEDRRGNDLAWLTALERRGVVRRGQSGPIPPEVLKPGPGASAGVLAALLSDRRRGR